LAGCYSFTVLNSGVPFSRGRPSNDDSDTVIFCADQRQTAAKYFNVVS